MRLLASTDFALRVLMLLATEPDRLRSTEDLAATLAISHHHLQKVVQTLAEAGFVATLRGAKGGVRLGRNAAEITVGAVIRRFERGQAPVDCLRADGGSCNLRPICRLKAVVAAACEAFDRQLDHATLAELVP